MTRVTATIETLMGQAAKTVGVYLRDAADQIDMVFGDGHAQANPQLVGAFISACATDFQTAMHVQSADLIVEAINNHAEKTEVFNPETWAEAFGGYAEQLDNAIQDHAKRIAANMPE